MAEEEFYPIPGFASYACWQCGEAWVIPVPDQRKKPSSMCPECKSIMPPIRYRDSKANLYAYVQATMDDEEIGIDFSPDGLEIDEDGLVIAFKGGYIKGDSEDHAYAFGPTYPGMDDAGILNDYVLPLDAAYTGGMIRAIRLLVESGDLPKTRANELIMSLARGELEVESSLAPEEDAPEPGEESSEESESPT